MQTSLRWILILIGLVIVVGIIWDAKRNNPSKRKSNELPFDRDLTEEDLQLDNEDFFIEESNNIEELNTLNATDNAELDNTEEFEGDINDIIMLHIMAPRLQPFLGEQLMEAFEGVNLYYRENQIFHRHENNDGTGKLLFSVVSAIEPGYFDLDKIQNFKTPGITLFFALRHPNHSIAAFESMLRTARQLAADLGGEVRDDKHKILTSQAVEGYRERIRLIQVAAFKEKRVLSKIGTF